jgi:hypothetical protein
MKCNLGVDEARHNDIKSIMNPSEPTSKSTVDLEGVSAKEELPSS